MRKDLLKGYTNYNAFACNIDILLLELKDPNINIYIKSNFYYVAQISIPLVYVTFEVGVNILWVNNSSKY